MSVETEPKRITQVITGADGVSRERVITLPIKPAPRKPLTRIEGPSAFGRDPRRFFNLLWLTSLQSYRLQYRATVLGYLWTLLRPLAFFAVLYVVFTQVLRFGGAVENYAVLLLLNIMLFQFFADATGTSLASVVRNEPMVRKLHFPRIVIPLSVVTTACMTSAMNLVVVFGFMLVSGVDPRLSWLLLPVIVLPLVVFAAGMSLLLSTLYVSIRDISELWNVAMRVLFYATPILYPLEFVPESFRWLLALNPLAPILYEGRAWLVDPDAPPITEVVGPLTLAGSAAIGLGICVLGLWLFVRRAPKVAEAL